MSKYLSISLIIVSLILGMGIGYIVSPAYSGMKEMDLGAADDQYDLRFIDEMIAHHQTAIEMAQDAQTKSSRQEIWDIAKHIIDDQTSEIQEMRMYKQEWYGE